MANTITAANAIFTLTIPGVFAAPQQLQGFSADDIFSTSPIKPNEVSMGVDGILSGGRVFVPVTQEISLQANSQSKQLFDNWNAAEQTIIDSIVAQGVVALPSLGQKWVLTNGFLTTYVIMPDAGRILKPVKYEITWGSVIPQAYTP